MQVNRPAYYSTLSTQVCFSSLLAFELIDQAKKFPLHIFMTSNIVLCSISSVSTLITLIFLFKDLIFCGDREVEANLTLFVAYMINIIGFLFAFIQLASMALTLGTIQANIFKLNILALPIALISVSTLLVTVGSIFTFIYRFKNSLDTTNRDRGTIRLWLLNIISNFMQTLGFLGFYGTSTSSVLAPKFMIPIFISIGIAAPFVNIIQNISDGNCPSPCRG